MDKYIDNKLAEEMDLIVLTTDTHEKQGLPKGSVGTLIDSYTGHDKPLYGDFRKGKKHLETALGLHDFRVLDPDSPRDIGIIASYLRSRKAIRNRAGAHIALRVRPFSKEYPKALSGKKFRNRV